MIVLVKACAHLMALLLAGHALFRVMLTDRARHDLGLRLAPLFLILTVCSIFSPSLLLLHLVTFAIIPVLARTRSDAAILLLVAGIAIPPFDSVLIVGGLKLMSWSVQNTLALGALLTFAIARGPWIRRRWPADLPMLLLMLLSIVVAARESSFTNFLREACTALFNFWVPYWVITRGIDPRADGRKLLLWLAGAGGMIGVVAVYEAVTYWPLYRVAGSLFDQHGSGLFVIRMGFMRATGPLANSTVLGFALVFTFVAALLSRPAFRSAAHQGLVVGAIGAGIVASQSRGAMLGAAIAVILLLLFNPRGRTGGTALLAIIVAGLFSLLMAGLTIYEEAAAGTVSYRRQLMERGVEEFWKHPLAGDTIEAVTKRMRDLTTGEHIVDFVNTYLYFALFTGIFGAILFLVALLIEPVKLWRRRHRLPPDRDHLSLARFCFAFILSAAVMLCFTWLGDRMAVLLMAAAGMAGGITAPRRRSTPPALAGAPLPGPSRPGGARPIGGDDGIRLPALHERELPHV